MLEIEIEVGEQLHIGDDIVVAKSGYGNQIRLGVVAPYKIPILREEARKRSRSTVQPDDTKPICSV